MAVWKVPRMRGSAKRERGVSADLLRFAEEAGAALVNLREDPANEGEQAFAAREWWE
jgi:hypothetical protein